MSTQQPEALRLVEQYDYGDPVAPSGEYPPLPEPAGKIQYPAQPASKEANHD